MTPETIKVAIADDHKIFRKGVILSLRPYTNLEFVFEAENGEELLQKIRQKWLAIHNPPTRELSDI